MIGVKIDNQDQRKQPLALGRILIEILEVGNWDTENTSTDPCSDTYAGNSVFSSPESHAIASYLRLLNKKSRNPISLPSNDSLAAGVVSFVDLHSYSQRWMYPPAYQCNSSLVSPIHKSKLLQASLFATERMFQKYGVKYNIGDVCSTIDAETGTSADYSFFTERALYSFTIELPDSTTYGFLTPPNRILPIGASFTEGFFALIEKIEADLPYLFTFSNSLPKEYTAVVRGSVWNLSKKIQMQASAWTVLAVVFCAVLFAIGVKKGWWEGVSWKRVDYHA
ncbi:hypothetical protein HK098_002151 [Nowakowskiella sp. JEL0407]|nr:hypothetical protein HK098_002151 [Nowakowskiella sp. JEL0407]